MDCDIYSSSLNLVFSLSAVASCHGMAPDRQPRYFMISCSIQEIGRQVFIRCRLQRLGAALRPPWGVLIHIMHILRAKDNSILKGRLLSEATRERKHMITYIAFWPLPEPELGGDGGTLEIPCWRRAHSDNNGDVVMGPTRRPSGLFVYHCLITAIVLKTIIGRNLRFRERGGGSRDRR